MKKHLVKHKAKFKDCKNCVENNDRMLRLQQRFKSEAPNVFEGKVKILPNSNDDNRLQILAESSHIYVAQVQEMLAKQN